MEREDNRRGGKGKEGKKKEEGAKAQFGRIKMLKHVKEVAGNLPSNQEYKI